MDYMPLVVILAVLAVIVLILLAYRRKLTAWEDDSIHIQGDETGHIGQQKALAAKLAKVDLVGKILTVIVVFGSLALLAVYIYLNQFADTGVKMG